MQNPTAFDALARQLITDAAVFTLDHARENSEQWRGLCSAVDPEYRQQDQATHDAFDAAKETIGHDRREAIAALIEHSDAALALADIEVQTAFQLGRRAGRIEADRQHGQTPLERFIDTLQANADAGQPETFTPAGWAAVLAGIRAAVPYLPSIIAFGKWSEHYDGPTRRAIEAATAATADALNRQQLAHDPEADTQDATYYTGLLIGLALAHALTGTHLEP